MMAVLAELMEMAGRRMQELASVTTLRICHSDETREDAVRAVPTDGDEPVFVYFCDMD
jgi:hypothetical protein